MPITEIAYCEYEITYTGRVNADAAFGALASSGVMSTAMLLHNRFIYDDVNDMTILPVVTREPFSVAQLAVIAGVIAIPTLWFEASDESILYGVTGYDTVMFELWSGQGVTSVDFLLNGQPFNWAVSTDKDIPAVYEVQATSGPGVLIAQPLTNGSPIFVPQQVTVGAFTTFSVV